MSPKANAATTVIRFGLAWRIAIAASAILTAAFAGGVYWLAEYVGQRERAALEERGEAIGAAHAGVLALALWEFNRNAIDAALSTMAADPDFVSATLLDADGVEQRRVERDGGAPAEGARRLFAFDLEHRAFGRSEPVGRLELALSEERSRAALAAAERRFAIGAAVVFVFTVVAIALTVRAMLAPIGRAVGALSTTRSAAAVPGLGRRDEVGAIARAIDEAIRARDDRQRRVGELAQAFEAEVTAVVARLEERFRAMSAVCDAVGAELVSADGAADALREMLALSASKSGAIADSTRDIASAVKDIAARSTSARTRTGETAQAAERSNSRIAELAERIAEIDRAAASIGEIARKTKLLGFNASIEAARSKDRGLGFAIVAEEVRALANATETTTNEILALSKSIRASSEATESFGREVTRSCAEVGEMTADIAAKIVDQTNHNQAIVERAAQLDDDVEALEARVGEVKTNLGQIAHKMLPELLEASNEVDDEIDRLRQGLDGFVGELHAS